MIQKRAVFAFALALSLTQTAFALDPSREIRIGMDGILRNLNETGIERGVIIASPSRRDPDYFFHWVRDAGLTAAVLTDQIAHDARVAPFLREWVAFERAAQARSASAVAGFGEPKFHVNGDVFTGPWGRPQNDGPAIRAWAVLRAFGTVDPMVRADLEYTRQHWRQTDFDLWEEVKGSHFFTRYAQMAAFRLAAQKAVRTERARSMNYALEAQAVEESLGAFVDTNRGLVLPTINHQGGVQKHAGLDISVILAPLYFGSGQRWSISNSYVLSTAHRLEETFRALYPVNQRFTNMAPGIGRYPEDVYDGNGFSHGHAWYLATFGMGEFYCTLVQELIGRGSIRFDRVNGDFFQAIRLPSLQRRLSGEVPSSSPEFWTTMQGLQRKGQSFLERAVFHVGQDRRYAEQFDRFSGYRRGATDLTWSYAASVRAFSRCQSSALLLKTRSPMKAQ